MVVSVCDMQAGMHPGTTPGVVGEISCVLGGPVPAFGVDPAE